MLSGKRHHRYTYADYVGLELERSTKHEFLDGEIFAMAGGSEEHSALAAEVLRAFGDAVRNGPRRVHTSDLRIYVESSGLATFPDGTVICEVTSDSSEEYDTGEKLEHYRTIPSLLDCVVLSHRERRITVHSRSASGDWVTRVAIPGGSVAISGLNSELSVDEIYGKSSIL